MCMRNDGTNKPFKFGQCIAAAAIDSAKRPKLYRNAGEAGSKPETALAVGAIFATPSSWFLASVWG